MTSLCPRCGNAFESRATTATRCPSCRAVVHISRGASRWSLPPRSRIQEADDESTELASGGGGILMVIAVLVLGGVIVYELIRRWRSRQARAEESEDVQLAGQSPPVVPTTAPTLAPGGPGTDAVPPLATRPDAATQGHTAPGFWPAA